MAIPVPLLLGVAALALYATTANASEGDGPPPPPGALPPGVKPRKIPALSPKATADIGARENSLGRAAPWLVVVDKREVDRVRPGKGPHSILDRSTWGQIGRGKHAPAILWGPKLLRGWTEIRDPGVRSAQIGTTLLDFERAALFLRTETGDNTWTADEAWRVGAYSRPFLVAVLDYDTRTLVREAKHARAFRDGTVSAQEQYVKGLLIRNAEKIQSERDRQEILGYIMALVVGPSVEIGKAFVGGGM